MDGRLVSRFAQRPVPTPPPATATNALAPVPGVPAMQWHPLRRLGQVVYPSDSPFGRPSAFHAGTHRLYVGTHSADVLVFDYDQTLVASARDPAHTSIGAVTALNTNADETHLAVGHALGYVSVYSLENGVKLVYTVEPLHAAPVRAEAHLLGAIVAHVCFQTNHALTVYSVDKTGVVCLHKQRRAVLGVSAVSVRLRGSYLRPEPLLAVCSWYGHLALLSESALDVFAASENDFVPLLHEPSSAIASQGAVAHNAARGELVCARGTQVSFYELNDDAIAARAMYLHNSAVEQIAFVARDAAILRTSAGHLDFLSLAEVEPLFSLPLPPSALSVTAVNALTLCMGRFEFYCGQMTNWSDRILALLNHENPARAVTLACDYFTASGDLQILGFPQQRERRRVALRAAFPDFVLTALRFALAFDSRKLEELVPAVVSAIILIRPSLLLETWELISACENSEARELALDLFLERLVTEIRLRNVRTLPAAVYRELVLAHPVPEIFYYVDLSTLDVDLAFKRVQDDEVTTFLENKILNDYTSALRRPDCAVFMAYILTGRVYPTGVEDAELGNAKMTIYSYLFLQQENLQAVLDIDEVGVFNALNEAFEDSFLNENHEINRQIIVNVLLSLDLRLTTNSRYIFLAENYPKYTQFLLLPHDKLDWIVDGLLRARSAEAQIALLGLLSAYKVHDMKSFVEKLADLRYTIVLEHIFRRTNKLHELVKLKMSAGDADVWSALSDALVSNRSETMEFISSRHVCTSLLNLNARMLGDFSARFGIDLWTFVQGPHVFEFMDAYFGSIGKLGGALPATSICTQYVSMLCDDGPKLLHMLETVFTKPEDVSLPFLVDDLLANNCVDALALLLCRKDRKEEAMIYVANHLPTLSGPEDQRELERYVNIALEICLDVAKESLWKRLLEASAEMQNRNILQMIVQTLSAVPSTDIVSLVRSVLASTDKTGSIPIVSLIYSDLERQEEILQMFYEILENESRADVYEVFRSRLAGWTVPVSSTCEACGVKIVGLGINASQLYDDWELALLNTLAEKNGNALVLFRCNHHYHLTCLDRMNGVDGSNSRHCVVCH